MNNAHHLLAMRHSLAHIMAAAIQELYPGAKFGVGPVISNGFYYDVDVSESLTLEDLEKIEAKMQQIIKANVAFEGSEMKLDEAIKFFDQQGQTYKLDLLKDLKQHGTTVTKDIDRSQLGIEDNDAKITTVGIYKNGLFTDLCRGPHVPSTGKVGAFKLTKIAGAYWRGDQERNQLQRIYGVAFEQKKELDEYFVQLAEAEKRDHRKLGKELDLFVSSPLIGSGLPLFTPRGTILREELNNFAQEFRLKRGYQKVWIPHIAKLETYRVSGHYEKFPELLKFESAETKDELALKPVNCPHHTQIYASRPRSYRELPIKYLETTAVYRDEKSGEMGGLSRVRSITQDDSHVFCLEDQVEDVFAELIEDAQAMYKILGLDLSLRLSFRDDSDVYLGEAEAWEKAQQAIERLAKKFKLDYEVGIGEAAIYGPKMDFMATDALGRMHQLATVQLDYAQPERFGLEYTASEGEAMRPVMIHCALLGSLERFLSVYIEHTAGAFPLWLAPEQVRLLTVNATSELVAFAAELQIELKTAGIRVGLDDANESVGKKIREAELFKVPYTVVIGEQEMNGGQIKPRVHKSYAGSKEPGVVSVEEFARALVLEIRERTGKTTL